jgi:hypothetical protein
LEPGIIAYVTSVAADRIMASAIPVSNSAGKGKTEVPAVPLGTYVVVKTADDYMAAEVVAVQEAPVDANGNQLDEIVYTLNPLGVFSSRNKERFYFGATSFPDIGTPVLPMPPKARQILFTGGTVVEQAEDSLIPGRSATRLAGLQVGTATMGESFDVTIRLNDFFSGHLAVLGNTGTGKSCTIASIMQALFTKQGEYPARGATFVILDVNGEYKNAFRGKEVPKGCGVQIQMDSGINVDAYVIDGSSAKDRLRLPHWLLSITEWELLLQSTEGAHSAVLRLALGLASLRKEFEDRPTISAAGTQLINLYGKKTADEDKYQLEHHILATCVLECFRGVDGDNPVAKYQRILSLLDRYGTPVLNRHTLERFGYSQKSGNFSYADNEGKFLDEIKSYIRPGLKMPPYRQTPFSFDDLERCIELAILYEEAHGNRSIRDKCAAMITRLKSIQDRAEYDFLRFDLKEEDYLMSQDDFLKQILGVEGNGANLTKKSQVIILNMNNLDDEIIELLAVVISRMLYEKLRYAENRNRFPVHILLEEAHRYIAVTDEDYNVKANGIYKRIAREGRKFGLFLIISSQRLYELGELSKSVLSQCSNFVIHRLQNPDDLASVRQMTPFLSESVFTRITTLPRQHALIFGTSVNLPTTFKVRTADPLPLSDDSHIKEIWFSPRNTALPLEFTPGTVNAMDRSEPEPVAPPPKPFLRRADAYHDGAAGK